MMRNIEIEKPLTRPAFLLLLFYSPRDTKTNWLHELRTVPNTQKALRKNKTFSASLWFKTYPGIDCSRLVFIFETELGLEATLYSNIAQSGAKWQLFKIQKSAKREA